MQTIFCRLFKTSVARINTHDNRDKEKSVLFADLFAECSACIHMFVGEVRVDLGPFPRCTTRKGISGFQQITEVLL